VVAIRRGMLIAGALLMVPAALTAEVAPRVTLEALTGVRITEGDMAVQSRGRGELDLFSTGNRDVRGWMQLRVDYDPAAEAEETEEAAAISIPRLEVRWRWTTPSGWSPRFTVGRSRLTWGEGRLFNAGDIINQPRPAEVLGGSAVAATADLREETQWLMAAYLPLGRFSYIETVALTGSEATLAAGGRVAGTLGPVKSEAGYLYRNKEGTHTVYMSASGHLLADLYGAVSRVLDPDNPTPAGAEHNTYTAGVLHTASHPRLGSLTGRGELLYSPGDATVTLFPELIWAPSQLLTLFIRSEIQPGTLYAPAGGVSWTPATGLTLALTVTALHDDNLPTTGGTTTVATVVRYRF